MNESGEQMMSGARTSIANLTIHYMRQRMTGRARCGPAGKAWVIRYAGGPCSPERFKHRQSIDLCAQQAKGLFWRRKANG
jgi:hypothetical protein